MPTAKQYRHQAVECLELAEQANELFVKAALRELAAEFQEMAEFVEQRQRADEEQTLPRRRVG